MKHITLNVDDLGLHPSINQAVCALAQQGLIHSASFMSLGHVAEGEWQALRQHRLEIGLHLDLTGLAAQGSLKAVMQRAWLRQWPPAQLRDLLARQLDAFEDQAGHPPVFVDGHQHVHQFPQVRTQLLAELQRRYGQRVWLRNTRPLCRDFKSQLIYHLGGATLERLARQQGLGMNRVFGGVYAFNDTLERLQARWAAWLAAAPARGTVLMCHPAVPGAPWADDILAARHLEWAWLSSPAFAQLWQQHGCQAQSWAAMQAASAPAAP